MSCLNNNRMGSNEINDNGMDVVGVVDKVCLLDYVGGGYCLFSSTVSSAGLRTFNTSNFMPGRL